MIFFFFIFSNVFEFKNLKIFFRISDWRLLQCFLLWLYWCLSSTKMLLSKCVCMSPCNMIVFVAVIHPTSVKQATTHVALSVVMLDANGATATELQRLG